MARDGDNAVKVVPVRHVGQWIGAAVVTVLVAMVVHTLFSKLPTGPRSCHLVGGIRKCHAITEWRFSWDVVFRYFTTSEIFHGLLTTLELTVLSMITGVVLGLIIAVMRLSSNRLLSITAWTYTWFFRGSPVLVQLFVWFNIGLLYPQLSLGIPFFNVHLIQGSTATLFTPFVAVFVGLSLNEGAYMSEIARAGILAVDEGQIEAATSIGMTRRQTLRFVVLPQAMRVIIPPTGNEVISMLKTTSLASTVGVTELLGAATNIYAHNYQIMALLIVASLWYLIVTTVLSIGQFYLERNYAKGALRTPPPTPLQRLRRDIAGILSKFRTPRDTAKALS